MEETGCGLSSLCEKTRMAIFQISLQRQLIFLSYLKTLSLCPIGAGTLQLPHDSEKSTTRANQAVVTWGLGRMTDNFAENCLL